MNHPSSGRRRTPEQEQERQSRLQLALAWKDWPLQSSAEDLGEDLLFQIYAEGKSTGLSMYVQLKSTKNLAGLVPKRRSDTVAYDLETKDLLHWEGSVPPVVVVIWDVEKLTGAWQDVPELIKKLDKSGRNWRKKKSARVHLPLNHTTDEVGRDVLRANLARLALPMLSLGKEMLITPTFSFPKTPAGLAAFDELKQTIDEGGKVTLGKEFIEAWRMSEWWERPYGVRIPESVTISSSESTVTLSLQLQVVGPERTEGIPIHLRRTKAGRKRATFETEGKFAAVKMTLVLHEPDTSEAKLEMKLAFQHPCETVGDSLALTRFMIAVRQGGTVQIALPGGQVIGQPSLDLGNGQTLENFQWWERVLLKLSYIQARVGRFGQLSVKKLSDKDIPTIERLHAILQTGSRKTRMSFSATLDPTKELPSLQDKTQEGPLSIKINPFGEERLLGVKVPLGEVEIEFLEPKELLQQMRDVSTGERKTTRIGVKNTEVVQRFLDWEPPKLGPDRVPRVISRKRSGKHSRGKQRKTGRRG